MSDTHAVLDLAVRLARDAGRVQREYLSREIRIDTKSSDVDLVTEVDQLCERRIVERIEQERPGDAILAEEGGGEDRPGAEWRWVIDPLDGTTNYAHRYPCFAVSLGVEREGEATVGVVYNPMLDELFHAVRGGGAFLNGRPITVSDTRELGRCLVATGFAYDRRCSDQDNLGEIAAVLRETRALRRDGSAALDLCAVAMGRFDAYWEFKLSPWDVCAGMLICHEAGGRCSSLDGGPAPASGAEVVASNGHVHDHLLGTLRRGRSAWSSEARAAEESG